MRYDAMRLREGLLWRAASKVARPEAQRAWPAGELPAVALVEHAALEHLHAVGVQVRGGAHQHEARVEGRLVVRVREHVQTAFCRWRLRRGLRLVLQGARGERRGAVLPRQKRLQFAVRLLLALLRRGVVLECMVSKTVLHITP